MTHYTLLSGNPKRFNKRSTIGEIIIAILFLVSGLWIHCDKPLRSEIQNNIPRTDISIDDQLMYAPVLLYYGVEFLGLKPQHNFIGRTLLLAGGYIFSDLIVYRTKKATDEIRPNGGKESFPSQHTNKAMVPAMLLHREYGHPVVSLIGFLIVLVVGYCRVGRNWHWSSDVLVGASVGILTITFLFYLYQKVEPKVIHQINALRNRTKGK